MRRTDEDCYPTFPPHFQVAPLSFASPSVLPLTSTFVSSAGASGLEAALAANDCSKSAMMSSMCSVPTEMRMRSSVTPLSSFSWSLSCSCVVVHGWIASVFESPTLTFLYQRSRSHSHTGETTYFARLEINWNPSTTWLPASCPPLTPNESTPPNPLGRYFFAN